MFSKRMKISLIMGAILGIVCIIGAFIRSEAYLSATYLFSFWYNRLLIGMVIGLTVETAKIPKALVRGALIGLLVSFAFYSATSFLDPIGFIAGIVYGVIIEFVAKKYVS
ncbi:MAG: hypothetical protein ACLFPS_07945 [Clostridia bacterium]